MAEHDTFVIRDSGGRWVLRRNARGIASFATRSEAERAALERVELSRRNGRSAEVFIQHEGDEIVLFAKAGAGLIGPIDLKADAKR
jgi:hypothetical protein